MGTPILSDGLSNVWNSIKESVRNFQKLKYHKYPIKYYIMQKCLYLKILFFFKYF